MKYFYSSFIIAAIGLIFSYYIGGFSAIYICFLLGVLEVSLSFDNAVVNAKVLKNMTPIWQQRFILWGIPIAVFGMRFIFPILIVSIAAKIGMVETFMLALNEPNKYHEILAQHKNEIYIFGGAFLLMVFNEFFFDEEREVHWIKHLENNPLTKFTSSIQSISAIIAIVVGITIIYITANTTYAIAYFSAILLYLLISSFNEKFSANGIRNGFIGFLYLETLDASFSFDGVIGAFALSENILIIMIGLGIGAMFVRSITIYLVEKKTLDSFIYLEHGAHYAILCLSLIMFFKVFHEVSEIITGTIGFAFILAAFIGSLIYKNNK